MKSKKEKEWKSESWPGLTSQRGLQKSHEEGRRGPQRGELGVRISEGTPWLSCGAVHQTDTLTLTGWQGQGVPKHAPHTWLHYPTRLSPLTLLLEEFLFPFFNSSKTHGLCRSEFLLGFGVDSLSQKTPIEHLPCVWQCDMVVSGMDMVFAFREVAIICLSGHQSFPHCSLTAEDWESTLG